jgi:hypothetical protein
MISMPVNQGRPLKRIQIVNFVSTCMHHPFMASFSFEVFRFRNDALNNMVNMFNIVPRIF